MEILYQNLLAFDRYDLIMIGIGCLLVYLAIAKEMEPSLLLPMGFGTILVNIPFSDALVGPIQELYHAGIANELFPLLLFIGIGAGLCVRAGGATCGDDALAMSLTHATKIPIQWIYLISDLTVLLLSLSYIPVYRIVCSLITVVLSGQIIGWIQKIPTKKVQLS